MFKIGDEVIYWVYSGNSFPIRVGVIYDKYKLGGRDRYVIKSLSGKTNSKVNRIEQEIIKLDSVKNIRNKIMGE